MKNQSSLKMNYLLNMILTVSSFLFPLITFPYISRVLEPEGMGRVAFASSVVTYFSMIAQLGIPTYGIRACAKVRDDKRELSKVVQELLIINLITCTISSILFLLVIEKVPRMHDDRLLFLILGMSILFNSIGMEWLFSGLEKYAYMTGRSLCFKILSIVLMFIFVKGKEDYVKYGAITVIAGSAYNLLNLIYVRRFITLKPVGRYCIKKHLPSILVFFAMSCATVIYTNMDTVMLGFMTSDAEVGYYSAAIKVKVILVSIVTSLAPVLLPRASYYFDQGEEGKFQALLKKALRFAVLISMPLMVYFTVFAKESVLFLSGEAYLASVAPMQILMPTLLLIGITNVIGIQMLVPMGKEKIVLVSEIMGAAVDLVFNLLLIPQYGAAGAATGTLIAELTVLLVQVYGLQKQQRVIFKDLPYGTMLMLIGISVILTVWIKWLYLSPFISLVLSSVLFMGGYGLGLLWREEPLAMELKDQVLRMCRR